MKELQKNNIHNFRSDTPLARVDWIDALGGKEARREAISEMPHEVYEAKPLPDDLTGWRRREAIRYRLSLRSRAYRKETEHGEAIYWKNNDQTVITRDLVDAYVRVPDGHEETRRVETEQSIEEYREARENMSAESKEELRREARAAFGPGQTVINIATGERFTT